MPERKLRMGMVGGGLDAFIGSVHRMAANLDGKIELVAGAFSSDPGKSKLSGKELYIAENRIYANYQEMAEKEAALPADDRIDFVSIVTPNFLHFDVAKTFLEAGFHVICDKPMTFDLAQAEKLKSIVDKSGLIFGLTHNYTGYPMVKQARAMVEAGEMGKVMKIVSEYPQGWLMTNLEEQDQKQAAWRTNPEKAGASCCIGDIGTHAENLARYITGLKIEALCAEFTTFVPGRALEDDGNILVRYEGGAKGILYASQISGGDENNLNIRIYGTKGSLEWYQENPNELIVKYADRPREIYRRGNEYLKAQANEFSRLPAGHPEAFIEAFANIYLEVARAIADKIDGKVGGSYDYPNVEDGVYGMKFIEKAVESSKSLKKWTQF